MHYAWHSSNRAELSESAITHVSCLNTFDADRKTTCGVAQNMLECKQYSSQFVLAHHTICSPKKQMLQIACSTEVNT